MFFQVPHVMEVKEVKEVKWPLATVIAKRLQGKNLKTIPALMSRRCLQNIRPLTPFNFL